MRANVFLWAFALIFFLVRPSFSATPGQIVLITDSSASFMRDNLNGNPYTKPVDFEVIPYNDYSHYVNGVVTQTLSLTTDYYIPSYTAYVCAFRSSTQTYGWIGKARTGFYAWPAFHSVWSQTTKFPSGTPASNGMTCEAPSACDTDDDDSDGVCNQCDQVPNSPDPDDVLVGQASDASGNLSLVSIKKGSTGEFEHWVSPSYSNSDRFVANIGSESKGKLNCSENCSLENPCVYSSGPFASILSGLEPSTPSSLPGVDEILDELTDLPPPDQLPERCDGHNAQCSSFCSDKLGVALSYCRDKDGQKVSDCQCNNDFAYNMVTGEPGDTLKDNADSADLTKDSNNSGVPDYADDSILNQGDSDSDGITDKADVDHTGGQDADGNGIDDAYTANAQASANASAGLSKSDSLNLDSIATSTAQTSAAAQGLKTGVDRIGDNTDDLKEKADAAIAESQAIRAKLDSFSQEGTASLATQEGQLVDGLFPGIQSGDIPEDPTEDFDVDSFVSEFSFAFPDEMKDLIDGSKIETTNSDSCISGTVMGQQIQFCFDQFHAVFVAMGILFQGLCVFRAFGIVVGGFGR